MEDYKYVSPVDLGYKELRLTKEQHNELFPYRKIAWSYRYEYYYNDDYIIMHRFINWKGVLFATLTFPVVVLLNGIANVKELWKELTDLYNQKETGSFDSDSVRGDRYEKIMKLIK